MRGENSFCPWAGNRRKRKKKLFGTSLLRGGKRNRGVPFVRGRCSMEDAKGGKGRIHIRGSHSLKGEKKSFERGVLTIARKGARRQSALGEKRKRTWKGKEPDPYPKKTLRRGKAEGKRQHQVRE